MKEQKKKNSQNLTRNQRKVQFLMVFQNSAQTMEKW